jgi:hypothetical protein
MKLRKVTRKLKRLGLNHRVIVTRDCFLDGSYSMCYQDKTLHNVCPVNIKRLMQRAWKMTYWNNNVAVGWGGVEDEV